MVRQLGAALLVAALQAARCSALAEGPARFSRLQQQRQRRKQDTFLIDDPCWLFVQMPHGREVPDLRAPCAVTSVNAALGRYNVTLPVAPTEVELLEVPGSILSKVDPKEYMAALKNFKRNSTLAELAARYVSADHAKRQWLAEERRNGLPAVKDKEWRDEFNARQEAVWEEASRNFLDKVKQDALAAEKDFAARSLQHEAERTARVEKADAIEKSQLKHQLKHRRGRKGESSANVAVSLRRAQEIEDIEHAEEADREAEMQKYLHPGSFRVRVGPLQVTKSARPDSTPVADLDNGAVVNVVLVSQAKDGSRVRGLIEEPMGWITLYHKYTRLYYVEVASQ